MQKMKGLKRALAVVAVLAMTGTAAWAKNGNGNGPSVPGDLSADRTEVTVSIPAAACTTVTQTGAIVAYIFQPSGRLLAIGIGNDVVTCNGLDQIKQVIVEAIDGLSFKPGPATLLYRYTISDGISTPTVVESGSRIDLH